MEHEEIQALRNELEEYRKEKEQIKQFVGQIGGTDSRFVDKFLNHTFILLIITVFALDIFRHFFHITIPYFSAMLSLEIGVLLVSLKIIWMMHKQAKVEHFQFWILNSIEFRLNALGKNIKQVEKQLRQNNKSQLETESES